MIRAKSLSEQYIILLESGWTTYLRDWCFNYCYVWIL